MGKRHTKPLSVEEMKQPLVLVDSNLVSWYVASYAPILNANMAGLYRLNAQYPFVKI